MRHGELKRLAALATGISLFAFAQAIPARAEMLTGLMGGKSLVTIDTEALKATGMVEVQGGNLLGFDVRPMDGQLYGLTTGGAIVIVDPKSGKLTPKSMLSEKIAVGVTVSVDFNPVADRMRIISSDGTSLRVNVEDGKAIVDGSLKFADTDGSKGKSAKVTAAAYTNSMAGTKETALYDIDTTSGSLLKQMPPNDGILNTVGPLGIKLEGPVAFDIVSDGKGGNVAFLLSGTTLHTIDLATGAAKPVGTIAGLKAGVTDIAVMAKK